MSTISQRSELLFLYDVKQANPNGDPMDANRPRMHEETGRCLVTDVRLKRTVRDYLIEKGYNGKEDPNRDIFIRDEDGKPVTGDQRSKSYKDFNEFVQKFIDVRMFGGVSAPKSSGKKGDDAEKKAFHITGPVQFGMGRSLHPVKENFIKGTGAFATKEGADQRTFREEYNITYGLIAFHGVINESAARHTGLTEEDVAELMDGLWNGTKNLLTRSKKGHMPRLLIKIDYKKPQFFIGDLVERLKMAPDKGIKEESFTDIDDFLLDISALNEVLKAHASHIARIHVMQDERVRLSEPVFKPLQDE
jgi:CRISPR-associated protein Csh2